MEMAACPPASPAESESETKSGPLRWPMNRAPPSAHQGGQLASPSAFPGCAAPAGRSRRRNKSAGREGDSLARRRRRLEASGGLGERQWRRPALLGLSLRTCTERRESFM